MKNLLFIGALSILSFNSFAQDDSKSKINKTFSIDGSVCITTDGKAAYYNMGGAQIKFDFNHKIALTLTLLPSLGVRPVTTTDSYGKKSTTINAVPVLGMGPQIFIKRLILSFPFYYRADKKIWVATAGIGYRIQYSKSK